MNAIIFSEYLCLWEGGFIRTQRTSYLLLRIRPWTTERIDECCAADAGLQSNLRQTGGHVSACWDQSQYKYQDLAQPLTEWWYQARSWMDILVVDAAGEQCNSTPEQLRLVGMQLKSVGLHPAVHLINTCRQALLYRSSMADGLQRPCVSSA